MGRTDNEYLARLLALEDAVWTPLRDWADHRPATTYQARWAWEGHGVPVPFGGGDQAGRKAAERRLARLEAGGLCTVHRPGGRARAARLTAAGEAAARRLLALPGLDAAVAAMRLMRTRPYHAGPGYAPGEWVAETELADHPWGVVDATPFARVEDDLLPALRRGWVESRSTLRRHVYYRVTAAGVAALAGPDPAPAKAARFDRRLWDLYLGTLLREHERLGSAPPPDPKQIGLVPLPASMGLPIPRTGGDAEVLGALRRMGCADPDGALAESEGIDRRRRERNGVATAAGLGRPAGEGS